MAVLWLKQMTPSLSSMTTNPTPEQRRLDGQFRDQILALLQGWATWPLGRDRYRVSWVNNLVQQAPTAHDCVVYFVHNYTRGVIQATLTTSQATVMQNQLAIARNPSNFREVGLTAAGGSQAHASEVYLGKCLSALRQLRRDNPVFTPRELREYPLLLAMAALHEAMHNKVEPEMPPNWSQHNQGGGGVAGSMIFAPGGQLLGPPGPTQANQTFLQQHFASRHPQYIA